MTGRVQTAAVTLAVVLVLVLAGWLWLREHDARVRADVAAQRSEDSLATVIATERRERAAERHADSLRAAARIAAADRTAFRARADATIAAGRYAVLLDSLAAMAPDTLEGFVQRMRAGWLEVQHRQDSALAAADARVAVRDLRIAELEADSRAALAACDAQVDEAMRQLDAANDGARPGLLERARQIVPWAAAFFVAGRLMR